MVRRGLRATVAHHLAGSFPVVALLGPRQVGKTTLALDLAEHWERPTVYLDLERDSDRNKLTDAELYLQAQRGKLVILDEVQRRLQLFPLLRDPGLLRGWGRSRSSGEARSSSLSLALASSPTGNSLVLALPAGQAAARVHLLVAAQHPRRSAGRERICM